MSDINENEKTLIKNISFPKNYYLELREFYKEVYQDRNFENKILTTRRSYDVYKYFEAIFDEDNTIERHGHIYSSHSACLIGRDAESVMIADDVMINGRAVKKLADQFMTNYGFDSKKVGIKVFVINKNANVIDRKVYNFLDVNIVSETEWRMYSDLINALVVNTGNGYISCINSYTIKDVEKGTFEKIVAGNEVRLNHTLNNYMFKEYNIKSKIIFLDNEDSGESNGIFSSGFNSYRKLLRNYNMTACLRLYEFTNSDTEKPELLLIPYVFLPSLTIEAFKSAYTEILKALPIDDFGVIVTEKENSFKIFNSDDKLIFNDIYNIVTRNNQADSEDEKISGYEFLYVSLTYLLSCYLYELLNEKYFKKILQKEPEEKLNCSNDLHLYIKYSNPLTEIKKLSKQTDNKENNVVRESAIKECTAEFVESFTSFINGNNLSTITDADISNVIEDYLFRMRTIDQKKAQRKQKRTKGIRCEDIDFIINDILSQNEDEKLKFDIYTSMINNADSGNGSLVVNIFPNPGDDVISLSLINGEQIYKYPFLNTQANYDYKCFKNLFPEPQNGDLRRFAEYMKNKTGDDAYIRIFERLSLGLPNDFMYAIDNELPNIYTVDNYNLISEYVSNCINV